MEGCVLNKDIFSALLPHCTVMTRVALAKTCRVLRLLVTDSPLYVEWAEMNITQRAIRAIETGQSFDFVRNSLISSVRDTDMHTYLCLMCIWNCEWELFILICNRFCSTQDISHCIAIALGRSKNLLQCENFVKVHSNLVKEVLEGAGNTGDDAWVSTIIKSYARVYKITDLFLAHVAIGYRRSGRDVPEKFKSTRNGYRYAGLRGNFEDAKNHLSKDYFAHNGWTLQNCLFLKRPELFDYILNNITREMTFYTRINFFNIILNYFSLPILKRVWISLGFHIRLSLLKHVYRHGRMDVMQFLLEQDPTVKTRSNFEEILQCTVPFQYKNVRFTQWLQSEMCVDNVLKKRKIE
jgi:hypothetical protein